MSTYLTTIQVDDGVEWQVLKPEVFATIMDFFASGVPVVSEEDENQLEQLGTHNTTPPPCVCVHNDPPVCVS